MLLCACASRLIFIWHSSRLWKCQYTNRFVLRLSSWALHQTLLRYPINTTTRIFCICILFDTATCFGSPHQPSSGRALIHRKGKDGTGLSLYTVGVKLLQNNTYLLTPCSRVLLEKLTCLQLVKKFSAYYGTRRFITAFTSARHLSLSWASSIQSILPHPTS